VTSRQKRLLRSAVSIAAREALVPAHREGSCGTGPSGHKEPAHRPWIDERIVASARTKFEKQFANQTLGRLPAVQVEALERIVHDATETGLLAELTGDDSVDSGLSGPIWAQHRGCEHFAAR
jgi:hypothetical protein